MRARMHKKTHRATHAHRQTAYLKKTHTCVCGTTFTLSNHQNDTHTHEHTNHCSNLNQFTVSTYACMHVSLYVWTYTHMLHTHFYATCPSARAQFLHTVHVPYDRVQNGLPCPYTHNIAALPHTGRYNPVSPGQCTHTKGDGKYTTQRLQHTLQTHASIQRAQSIRAQITKSHAKRDPCCVYHVHTVYMQGHWLLTSIAQAKRCVRNTHTVPNTRARTDADSARHKH
eukprot:GDKI01018954.1.p1 GENE.GDKI01018954.1~~GDKI01018954.1.p1  ORF type:complete len:267 (+),score=46.64 GDKI01018954.1:121-801(+)